MKHDHKKTKKLKVALFSMIMFLPFIAIGVTCATHIFNEEVAEQTQTATINYVYETEQPQENDTLKNNYIYKTSINTAKTQNLAFSYIAFYDNTNAKTYELEQIDNTNNNFYVWYSTSTNELNITTINDETMNWINATNIQTIIFVFNQEIAENNSINFTQTNNTYNQVENEYIPIANVNITTTPQDQTTNIFYDSCDQVQDSFILNWCTNGNPINRGVNAFTNAFNVPNGHIINTLITYWLCISMIYIVIDIIIECIVYITHFFNKEV